MLRSIAAKHAQNVPEFRYAAMRLEAWGRHDSGRPRPSRRVHARSVLPRVRGAHAPQDKGGTNNAHQLSIPLPARLRLLAGGGERHGRGKRLRIDLEMDDRGLARLLRG